MRWTALTTGAPAVDGASDSMLTRRAGWIVGGVAIVASALILRAARGTNFFFDEWWFITHRRDASFDDFVRPHNGHLVAIPVAIYNALFRTVGLRSYTPYLLLLVALHVLTCVLLFVYLRRRAPVLYAVLATVMMLLLGNAWQDLVWAFQITYLLSAATGMAALLLLDRRDRVGDVGAMLAITASVLSGGLGLVFAGGALVELLWTRRDRRRLWVVAVPIAMYLVWYATNGASDGAFENFTHFDPYTTTLAGHAARSLFGTSLFLGKLIALVFLVIVAVQVVRTWPIGGRFANCIAMLVAYWLLLTYDRGNDIGGTESRYVYLSVLLMLLVGGEVLRTWQPIRSPNRVVAVVCAVVLLGVLAHAIVGNLDTLGHEGASLRATAADQKVRYSALVVARADADRDLPMWFFPNSFDAGAVIDAISELDYPVFTRDELRQLPERDRRAADDQLYAVLGGGDASPRALTGTEIDASEAVGGTLARDGACLTFVPNEPGAHLTVGGDELGVRVEATGGAPVGVAVRAVAHGFRSEPAFTVAPGASRDLVLRPTGMAPWSARLGATDPFRVCAVG